jgi:hypothetical protein
MKEIINLQNEVVLGLLNQDAKAYEDKLTSVPGQTGIDGAAGGKTSAGTNTNKSEKTSQKKMRQAIILLKPSSDQSKEGNELLSTTSGFKKFFGLAH